MIESNKKIPDLVPAWLLYLTILLDIFTKPMVFGRKEGQDVLDKSEEIAAFGGQDGKAVEAA